VREHGAEGALVFGEAVCSLPMSEVDRPDAVTGPARQTGAVAAGPLNGGRIDAQPQAGQCGCCLRGVRLHPFAGLGLDSMKRLETKRQFSAVAQMVGFGPRRSKCLIFQWGLSNSLSAISN
jgi:hypothetical protein